MENSPKPNQKIMVLAIEIGMRLGYTENPTTYMPMV
jgi:hypothetical protein